MSIYMDERSSPPVYLIFDKEYYEQYDNESIQNLKTVYESSGWTVSVKEGHDRLQLKFDFQSRTPKREHKCWINP